MRYSPAGVDGRGDLRTLAGEHAGEPDLWLLIGNSRWHWAEGPACHLRCWSSPPPAPGAGVEALLAGRQLCGWAAVGTVPEGAALDPKRRLHSQQVPLERLPAWIGVDRALVAWRAWRLSQAPVLVADAGTALSLTRVDRDGGFAGGRIQAGRALQLRALGDATAQLPTLSEAVGKPCGRVDDSWPAQTMDAMEQGVREGLVAAVAAAWREVLVEEPATKLWITGGDGPWLAAALGLTCNRDLALQGLAELGGRTG